MHVLFLHQMFPGQFGHVGLELTNRYGWKCSFLAERLSGAPWPTEEMVQKLGVYQIPGAPEKQEREPWNQSFHRFLDLGLRLFEGARASGLRPDLVVAHGSFMPSFVLRELLPCPVVNYCEYYYALRRRDFTYRLDLPPPAGGMQLAPRALNANSLVNLVHCDAGYSPIGWQRQTYPERFRHKIEVHFDGIDTHLFRRRDVPRVIAGRAVPAGTRIVTYVSRGLESIRGFDLFMRTAQRVARARPDVLFAVVGNDQMYYGWDSLCVGPQTFKQWTLAQGDYDLSRFLFLGILEPNALAELLSLSDLHLFLTIPATLSWSLFNALACGCVVLASDVPPVREVIEPGVTGLVEPVFDTDRLAETALRVLDDPEAFRPLGNAARALMEEKYSTGAVVPGLKDFFERVVSRGAQAGP